MRNELKSAVLSGARRLPTTVPPALAMASRASASRRSAEGVVGGDEEEAVELLLDQKPHQRDPVRPIVGVPLDAVRRAGLAGEIGGRGGIEDDDPVASLGQVLNRQPHARIGDVEYRPHAPLVIPLPRDGEADIDLVLMIGDQELDRLAQHRTAEILDRHPRALRAARSRQIGIRAGLIVENADPEGVVGARRRGGKDQKEEEGESSPKHSGTPRGGRGSLLQLQRKRNRRLVDKD